VESFKSITDSLTGAGISPEEAGLKLIPKNEIELEPDATVQVMRTIEVLEELDDVQEVFSNLTITDEAIAKLEGA
jgi:transcriptional/translational regulatory protein YebC/TACO1